MHPGREVAPLTRARLRLHGEQLQLPVAVELHHDGVSVLVNLSPPLAHCISIENRPTVMVGRFFCVQATAASIAARNSESSASRYRSVVARLVCPRSFCTARRLWDPR